MKRRISLGVVAIAFLALTASPVGASPIYCAKPSEVVQAFNVAALGNPDMMAAGAAITEQYGATQTMNSAEAAAAFDRVAMAHGLIYECATQSYVSLAARTTTTAAPIPPPTTTSTTVPNVRPDASSGSSLTTTSAPLSEPTTIPRPLATPAPTTTAPAPPIATPTANSLTTTTTAQTQLAPTVPTTAVIALGQLAASDSAQDGAKNQTAVPLLLLLGGLTVGVCLYCVVRHRHSVSVPDSETDLR